MVLSSKKFLGQQKTKTKKQLGQGNFLGHKFEGQ